MLYESSYQNVTIKLPREDGKDWHGFGASCTFEVNIFIQKIYIARDISIICICFSLAMKLPDLYSDCHLEPFREKCTNY